LTPPIAILQDLHLIHQIRHGDQNAFARLYDRHVERIFKLHCRLTSDTEIAEDLTQETFLAAYSSLGKYHGRSAFGTWLWRIALNTHADYRRYARQLPETEPLEDELSAATSLDGDPLATCTRRDGDKALDEAIVRLPTAAREAFVLVRIEGLTYQQAADHLDIPVGTVQSRINRASGLLHRALSHLIYEDNRILPQRPPKESTHVVR